MGPGLFFSGTLGFPSEESSLRDVARSSLDAPAFGGLARDTMAARDIKAPRKTIRAPFSPQVILWQGIP